MSYNYDQLKLQRERLMKQRKRLRERYAKKDLELVTQINEIAAIMSQIIRGF